MSLELTKPEIYLCRPNLKRTTIAHLKEVDNLRQKLSKGNINDLSFTLPLFVDDYGELIKNKHVDMIKERLLIRFEKGNYKEYYIIDKIPKVSNDADSVSVQCFSLGYELATKDIRDYEVTSYTLSQIAHDMLKESIWTVGYVDPMFDLKYRSFDFSGTVLDSIFKIATTFQALPIWDTINRTISFYNPDTYGMNKGFKTSQGKLMEGLDYELNLDEFCTRLKVFGKDGMSFQSVNPLGSNFIQDFSYFMYPFEQDNSGKVLKHSPYMEDDLCKAIIKYSALVNSKETDYSALLNQKKSKEEILTTKNNELASLKTELAIIEDNLATANATGQPTSSLITQKNNKTTQINNKQGEVNSVAAEIVVIDNNIANLNNLLKIENNFTSDQLKELNQFIIVKEITEDNISDPKELYEYAKKEFDKLREPKIVAKVSLVNFYEILSEQHNVGKLDIGDVIEVEHECLDIHIKANVTEIEFNYKEATIDVVVSNVQELLTDEDRFMKDHLKSVSTSNAVDMSKYKWNDAKATVDDVTTLLNNTWDAVKRDIVAGVNESVEISRRGIIIRDPNEPSKIIIIQHGQIALSLDNGNNWQVAIKPEGVFAERLIGRLILGNKLIISDDDGTFQIEGNLLTIKDKNGNVRLRLGEYTKGKYGLQIIGASGQVVLDESGIIQTDTLQEADNVDSTHPLKLKFYIDDSVMRIDKVKLSFSLERFRAYSKSIASGGESTATSSSGGGVSTSTQSGGYKSTSTSSGGYYSDTTGSEYWNSGNTHNHGISANTRLATHPVSSGGWVEWVPSGQHYHSFSVPSHTHDFVIPDHTHQFYVPEHSHYVSIPSHTHDIQYGIYESTYATGIRVSVDGVIRGSQYYADTNIDLTQWITTPGWHTIELSSTQLGRINASLYIRSFVGS